MQVLDAMRCHIESMDSTMWLAGSVEHAVKILKSSNIVLIFVDDNLHSNC